MNSTAVKEVMTKVTYGTCDDIRKVIKKYTEDYVFISSKVTDMVECYKGNELIDIKFHPIEFENIIKTDDVLDVFGIQGVELIKTTLISM